MRPAISPIPDFDGEPVQIYEPGGDDPIAPPDDVPPTETRTMSLA